MRGVYNKDKKSKKLITIFAFWKICIEKSIAFFKEKLTFQREMKTI